MNSVEDQTIALAGMFQSAALIEQLAHKGEINQAAFDCCIDSLFAFEADSTLDIFGDVAGLNRGFKALTEYLGGRGNNSGKNMAYYIMSMMKLSANLQKNTRLAGSLHNELRTIQQQSIDFDMSRNGLVSKIDGLYQKTISHLQPRIIVRGEQNYLTNPDNAAKIRALLLSGIRSTVLWHQLGGSKWKLLFARQKYVESGKRLLSNF